MTTFSGIEPEVLDLVSSAPTRKVKTVILAYFLLAPNVENEIDMKWFLKYALGFTAQQQ